MAGVLLRTRFAVYAVVVVVGALQLTHDDGAPAARGPGGRVFYGHTPDGRVVLWVQNGLATMLRLDLAAGCRSGARRYDEASFFDAYRGDFRRSHGTFADSWYREVPGENGAVVRVSAHMDGTMFRDGHGASGSFRQVARFVRGGTTLDVCTASFPWRARAG